MNWAVWQQHRKQFMALGILLVLFTAFMIPTGLHFWRIYQQALTGCHIANTCSQLSNELFTWPLDSDLFHFVQLSVLAVPFLLGLFCGVPLVAKEYADGTNRFVWTQSVSRRKWLSIKLVWTIIAAAVYAGIFAALATWWFRASNALYHNRFSYLAFDSQGIAPIAYAVFAVAVGIAVGTWRKRILSAFAITLGILLAVQISVSLFVRPHYATPRISTAPIVDAGPPPSPATGVWISDSEQTNNKGQSLDWANPPKQCLVADPNAPSSKNLHSGSVNGGPATDFDCLTSLGYHWIVRYQPSYRYWDFQRIETGLYLGLTVIPIAATYWLVLRRDA